MDQIEFRLSIICLFEIKFIKKCLNNLYIM
jgi:hypothetical protein